MSGSADQEVVLEDAMLNLSELIGIPGFLFFLLRLSSFHCALVAIAMIEDMDQEARGDVLEDIMLTLTCDGEGR